MSGVITFSAPYLVTESGILPEPVLSAIGEVHIGGGEPQIINYNTIGHMKLSPDGSKLAVAVSRKRIIEVFGFSNMTGGVETLLVKIQPNSTNSVDVYFYSIGFSSNSQSLFYTKTQGDCGNNEYISELLQFDLATHGTLKVGDFLGSLNSMQLAVNGKIYIASCNDLAGQSHFVGVINYPSRRGEQCDFKPLDVNLLNGRNSLGLPNFIQSYFHFPDPVLEMPNVFTPNGDRYNPFFVPLRFENALAAHLKIFNRWGKEVFSTDDVEAGWDGNGSSPGVYYWLLTYEGLNGKTGSLKGWVMMM